MGGGAALHWLGSLLEGQMMPGGEWPLRVAGQWAERQLLGFLLFVRSDSDAFPVPTLLMLLSGLVSSTPAGFLCLSSKRIKEKSRSAS